MATYKIKQIIPALPGYWQVIKWVNGEEEYIPIACWALVEVDEHRDDGIHSVVYPVNVFSNYDDTESSLFMEGAVVHDPTYLQDNR